MRAIKMLALAAMLTTAGVTAAPSAAQLPRSGDLPAQPTANRIDAQQLARLILLLRARAAQMRGAAPTAGSARIDTTGGIAGMIGRLNSMSQADVDRLMARPHFLNQFTPKSFDPLAGTGISSAVVRAAGNTRTILDARAQQALERQLVTVRRMGAIAQGMAAERNVRNQVSKHEYDQMFRKSSEEAKGRLYAEQAVLAELLRRLGRANRP